MCRLKKSCDFVAMDVGRDFMSMCLTLQIGGPIICFSCRALHSSASPAGKKTKVVAMPLPMTDAEVISRLQSSTKMQNKADFVKSVLQQTGMALEFVNPKFQKDPQMAKLAVENNAMALQFVSVQCKGLDQIALTAVKKNGLALQFVPPEICKEHILLAAVKQNGQALKYAVCPCGIAERGHRAGCCGEKRQGL